MFTPGDCFKMSNSTVYEYTHKKNKLRVLLCPVEGAAVCGYMRAVNAGSKDESACVPMGAAHFIEHMSFRIQNGKIWSLASKGDVINAMTNMDSTRFYVVHLPHQTEETIAIDADRFSEAAVPADKVPVERHAVINELERGERAGNKMFTTTSSIAILEHPYHHSTIGTRTDVEQTSAKDMETFRKKYYVPNNTTLIFCGAFDPKTVLQHVDTHFGSLEAGENCNPTHTAEPVQMGKRVSELNIQSPCPMICMAFRAPRGSTVDSVALQCISRLTWYNQQGRAKSLLDDNSLHDVSTYAPRQFAPYLWFFHGTQERTSETIRTSLQKRMLNILQSFIHSPVNYKDLDSVKASLRDDWNRSTESVTDIMNELGRGVSMGNWKDFKEREIALNSITSEVLQRVAGNVFIEQNMTVTHIIPSQIAHKEAIPMAMTSEESKAPPVSELPSTQPGMGWSFEPLSTNTNIIKVPRANYARVTLSARFAPEQSDLASLYVSVMEANDTQTTKLMNLHADRKWDHDHEFMHMVMALPVSKKMLKPASKIMFENEWLSPQFSSSHIELKKRQMSAELQSLKRQQGYRLKQRFITNLFQGSIYDMPIDTRIEKLNALGTYDVKGFHDQWLNSSSYVTMVTPNQEVTDVLHNIFPTYTTRPETSLQWSSLPRQQSEHLITLDGFGSYKIMMGQTITCKHDSKDELALQCAISILGGGMTGRLMHTVREQRGLGTYGLYSVMQHVSPKSDNIFCVQGTFSPSSLEEGMACTKQLVQEWHTHGVTPLELANSKDRMVGSRTIMADTVDNLHSMALKCILQNKNPKHEHSSWLQKVNSLTLEEVNTAIEKYIDPTKMCLVMVGPRK